MGTSSMRAVKIVYLLFGLLLCIYGEITVAQGQLLDRVAVIVNNKAILTSEIDAYVAFVQLNAQSEKLQLPEYKTLRRQVREQLITQQIQLQLAERLGLAITEDALNHHIAALAEMQAVSLEELYCRLEKAGIDRKEYRRWICNELLEKEIFSRQVMPRIQVSSQQVDALVKQIAYTHQRDCEYRLRHILLALPENPIQQQIEQKKLRAQQLFKQVQQGADFAQLAMAHSNEPQASKGGEWAWTKLDALPTPFADKLIGAKKGALIGPILTGVGFHILRVEEIRGAQAAPGIEYRVRHILLRPTLLLDDTHAKIRLQRWKTQIMQKKRTFAELARQYSQDFTTAFKDGEFAWSLIDAFPPELQDTLNTLQPEQISAPIRTAAGWHLLQLLETRRADCSETAQRDQAQQILLQRKFIEELKNWLHTQRSTAYVKIIECDDSM